MKKKRQENERIVRTFCAVADILLNGANKGESAKRWIIGYNPVQKALERVTMESLKNIPETMIVISAALAEADAENIIASRISNQTRKLRSLADSLGFELKKKNPQTTLF